MADFIGTDDTDFLFDGTAEDDRYFGLGGDDFLFDFAGGNDILDGGDGNDSLSGGDGDDTLIGGNGNDSVTGNAGADDLSGGAGDDEFTWRISAAFFGPIDSTSLAQDSVSDFEGAGAPGGDTLELVESTSRRMVFKGALAAMPAVGASVGGGGNNLTEVFYAFDGGDTIVFADSDDDGVFDADDFAVRLSGQHNLVVSDFGSTPFVIAGTEGNDTIVGTPGNDTIFGLGGKDTISGGGGNDLIDGGDGNDTLNGDAGNDRLTGGRGNDILMGGDGTDRITGGDGNDIIFGGAGRDTALSGGNGNDLVYGGEGDDTLDGDVGTDLLFGGTGDDDLFGGDDNDILFGEDGDDYVEGMDGNDQMFGGNGNDEMVGDAGADIMSGGAGDDEFRLFLGSFNPSSPFSGPDTVLDFEGAGVAGGDEIGLRDQVVFHGEVSLKPKLGVALPGGGNGLTDLLYTIEKGTTWLLADDNDNGRLDSADMGVRFEGSHRFTEADFRSTTFIIAGTNGDDTIAGTEGDDIIFGLGGNDSIFGLGGNDEMDGGAGDDFMDGGTGFDNLSGGDGNDTLTLQNSDSGGNASGGAGDDLLIGSDASSFSSLEGGEGNDTLRAGARGASLSDFGGGDDRLEGGVGDDQFFGGAGADLFVFGATWTAPDTEFEFHRDAIFDFENGVDKIDLRASGLGFDDLTIDNSLGFFTTITAPTAGRIEVSFANFSGVITEQDFLFAP